MPLQATVQQILDGDASGGDVKYYDRIYVNDRPIGVTVINGGFADDLPPKTTRHVLSSVEARKTQVKYKLKFPTNHELRKVDTAQLDHLNKRLEGLRKINSSILQILRDSKDALPAEQEPQAPAYPGVVRHSSSFYRRRQLDDAAYSRDGEMPVPGQVVDTENARLPNRRHSPEQPHEKRPRRFSSPSSRRPSEALSSHIPDVVPRLDKESPRFYASGRASCQDFASTVTSGSKSSTIRPSPRLASKPNRKLGLQLDLRSSSSGLEESATQTPLDSGSAELQPAPWPDKHSFVREKATFQKHDHTPSDLSLGATAARPGWPDSGADKSDFWDATQSGLVQDVQPILLPDPAVYKEKANTPQAASRIETPSQSSGSAVSSRRNDHSAGKRPAANDVKSEPRELAGISAEQSPKTGAKTEPRPGKAPKRGSSPVETGATSSSRSLSVRTEESKRVSSSVLTTSEEGLGNQAAKQGSPKPSEINAQLHQNDNRANAVSYVAKRVQTESVARDQTERESRNLEARNFPETNLLARNNLETSFDPRKELESTGVQVTLSTSLKNGEEMAENSESEAESLNSFSSGSQKSKTSEKSSKCYLILENPGLAKLPSANKLPIDETQRKVVIRQRLKALKDYTEAQIAFLHVQRSHVPLNRTNTQELLAKLSALEDHLKKSYSHDKKLLKVVLKRMWTNPDFISCQRGQIRRLNDATLRTYRRINDLFAAKMMMEIDTREREGIEVISEMQKRLLGHSRPQKQQLTVAESIEDGDTLVTLSKDLSLSSEASVRALRVQLQERRRTAELLKADFRRAHAQRVTDQRRSLQRQIEAYDRFIDKTSSQLVDQDSLAGLPAEGPDEAQAATSNAGRLRTDAQKSQHNAQKNAEKLSSLNSFEVNDGQKRREIKGHLAGDGRTQREGKGQLTDDFGEVKREQIDERRLSSDEEVKGQLPGAQLAIDQNNKGQQTKVKGQLPHDLGEVKGQLPRDLDKGQLEIEDRPIDNYRPVTSSSTSESSRSTKGTDKDVPSMVSEIISPSPHSARSDATIKGNGFEDEENPGNNASYEDGLKGDDVIGADEVQKPLTLEHDQPESELQNAWDSNEQKFDGTRQKSISDNEKSTEETGGEQEKPLLFQIFNRRIAGDDEKEESSKSLEIRLENSEKPSKNGLEVKENEEISEKDVPIEENSTEGGESLKYDLEKSSSEKSSFEKEDEKKNGTDDGKFSGPEVSQPPSQRSPEIELQSAKSGKDESKSDSEEFVSEKSPEEIISENSSAKPEVISSKIENETEKSAEIDQNGGLTFLTNRSTPRLESLKLDLSSLDDGENVEKQKTGIITDNLEENAEVLDEISENLKISSESDDRSPIVDLVGGQAAEGRSQTNGGRESSEKESSFEKSSPDLDFQNSGAKSTELAADATLIVEPIVQQATEKERREKFASDRFVDRMTGHIVEKLLAELSPRVFGHVTSKQNAEESRPEAEAASSEKERRPDLGESATNSAEESRPEPQQLSGGKERQVDLGDSVTNGAEESRPVYELSSSEKERQIDLGDSVTNNVEESRPESELLLGEKERQDAGIDLKERASLVRQGTSKTASDDGSWWIDFHEEQTDDLENDSQFAKEQLAENVTSFILEAETNLALREMTPNTLPFSPPSPRKTGPKKPNLGRYEEKSPRSPRKAFEPTSPDHSPTLLSPRSPSPPPGEKPASILARSDGLIDRSSTETDESVDFTAVPNDVRNLTEILDFLSEHLWNEYETGSLARAQEPPGLWTLGTGGRDLALSFQKACDRSYKSFLFDAAKEYALSLAAPPSWPQRSSSAKSENQTHQQPSRPDLLFSRKLSRQYFSESVRKHLLTHLGHGEARPLTRQVKGLIRRGMDPAESILQQELANERQQDLEWLGFREFESVVKETLATEIWDDLVDDALNEML